MLNQLRNRSGFTLIETVIALGLFCLLTVSAVSALSYAANASARLAVESELFENARIALDFMSAQIQACDYIDPLRTASDGTLRDMTVHYKNGDGAAAPPASTPLPAFHVLSYNAGSTGQASDHRLNFGGNEVASYIADINITVSDGVMRISVTSDDRLSQNGKPVVAPVKLVTKISVYNKIVY